MFLLTICCRYDQDGDLTLASGHREYGWADEMGHIDAISDVQYRVLHCLRIQSVEMTKCW